MKLQTERLIQTAIHSNPRQIVDGTVTNASGTVTINFQTTFIGMPVLIGLQALNAGDTAPVLYHKEWIVDGTDSRLYTGMKVQSNGQGNIISWCVEGIVKK